MSSTIRDVARVAKTSVTAVSAVLRGSTGSSVRVGQATRERILEAAAELRYTPNPIAQSLVTRKTRVLGLAFPYSSAFTERNPFFTQVMAGVFAEVIRERYNLMLHTAVGNDWNRAEENALLDPRVEGLILVLPDPHSATIARCQQRNFPCVAVIYTSDAPTVCTVNADDFAGGVLAAQYLIEQGHHCIVHLAGSPLVASTARRQAGFLYALQCSGLNSEAAIIPAGFDAPHGYRATHALLSQPSSQWPTGIFAANDLCAEGALQALKERGLRVPQDISLVGCDDSWVAANMVPPLTSVVMPTQDLGIQAARMLIALIEGHDILDRQPVLSVHLNVRQSCGPPAR